MQTIEKALHQPMPFTTGGQTITDRLTAAKHSLAGSQLGKTICKATTEELMAPKKKHLDYLLHCTHEPNVSIPQMANLLIERTQNPNWTVVYKSLITIHNIMCYGNERFSQYLASCNTTFNLGNFLDKGSVQSDQLGGGTGGVSRDWAVPGYDMSQHVKRGREDGLLRTMHADKLLKTLPILQNQIDALLEFQVAASELNNGVINCSFILLFRDLIRLFACYNDGVINLLEKYFDMNKKQCREALDMYKSFLVRLDKVADFLRVAESVGIDRGEIPDLARAPASLLEALESHLIQLEGGRPPPPSQYPSLQQSNAISQLSSMTAKAASSDAGAYSTTTMGANIDETAKLKYLEEEKERLRMYEEQRRRQVGSGGGATSSGQQQQFNPFGQQQSETTTSSGGVANNSRPSDDLLNLFDSPNPAMHQIHHQPQMPPQLDSTNPFASMYSTPIPSVQPNYYGMPSVAATNGGAFGTDFSKAFGNSTMANNGANTNPFLQQSNDQESNDEQQAPTTWSAMSDPNMAPSAQMWKPLEQNNSSAAAIESDSSDEALAAPQYAVAAAVHNPFGALQQNADALHKAGVGASIATPVNPRPIADGFEMAMASIDQQQKPQTIPSIQSSGISSPDLFAQHQQQQQHTQPMAIPIGQQQQQQQHLGIYEQTPFSHMDASYTSTPVPFVQMMGTGAQPLDGSASNSPALQQRVIPSPGATGYGIDPYSGDVLRPSSSTATQPVPYHHQQQQMSQQQPAAAGNRFGADIDSALSSLADNLSIGNKNTTTGKPVQWGVGGNTRAPMNAPTMWTPPQQPTGVMPGYPPQPVMYGQPAMMPMYGMQPPIMQQQPPSMMVRPNVYGGGMQQQQIPRPPSQDPFSNFQ